MPAKKLAHRSRLYIVDYPRGIMLECTICNVSYHLGLHPTVLQVRAAWTAHTKEVK